MATGYWVIDSLFTSEECLEKVVLARGFRVRAVFAFSLLSKVMSLTCIGRNTQRLNTRHKSIPESLFFPLQLLQRRKQVQTDEKREAVSLADFQIFEFRTTKFRACAIKVAHEAIKFARGRKRI